VSPADGELRLDALTGEWVTIVGGRQDRPHLPDDGCPFCVGGLEAPEPYTVRAFTNRWPPLTRGPAVEAGAGSDRAPARGAAEIVLYTPEHDASFASLGVDGVRRVVDLWAERTAALLDRPDVAYVLVLENRGREVGATIDHPHGQIYGFPFVPPVPAREAARSAEHGCVICTELTRERSDAARVVVGEVEARLAELRRSESTARGELQQVRAEHERTARSAAQRSDERSRETARAQRIRDELGRAHAEQTRLADQLRDRTEHSVALSQQVGQVRVDVAAVEIAAGRREAERAAREALHSRIRSEIAANAASRETVTERLAQLGTQRAELAQREAQLMHELASLREGLAPLEDELQSAEQRRAALVGERQGVEQRLADLRAADRAAHEIREARHVTAQRATDEVERINTEISETQELDAETSGLPADAVDVDRERRRDGIRGRRRPRDEQRERGRSERERQADVTICMGHGQLSDPSHSRCGLGSR